MRVLLVLPMMVTFSTSLPPVSPIICALHALCIPPSAIAFTLSYLALPPSGFCVRAPQKCTEYAEGCKPSDRVIQYFWTVLKDFSQAERVLYLRFVWGRSRLPVSRSAFDRLHRVRWHVCCLYPVCLFAYRLSH